MRALVVFCLIAVAAAQYDYSPVAQDEAQSIGGISGAAQLSQPIQPSNEFSKEFYSYSAPEQEFEDGGANEQIANSLKRNLRVVFIKGPENSGLENAALQLAKSASDDRTAIYVLNKQADISNLANQLQNLKSSNANKPEVHFVKYRTPADADNAQRTIQSQYDSLPGPSSNHNAGSAPVLDFASKAAPAPSSGYLAPAPAPAPGPSAYLPPNRRF
ncbi:uncharacterized protein LOC119676582 [Teleopsis dalmanni]|uniref:uncharacterized protein LOC119676582 n=1 Tax=Teleopsis dalmanni TaxID=139649 RepID=UPI0018CEE2C8|nr:uncharacterized protein LOC119676582 [Teleopsis dalmanni]